MLRVAPETVIARGGQDIALRWLPALPERDFLERPGEDEGQVAGHHEEQATCCGHDGYAVDSACDEEGWGGHASGRHCCQDTE